MHVLISSISGSSRKPLKVAKQQKPTKPTTEIMETDS